MGASDCKRWMMGGLAVLAIVSAVVAGVHSMHPSLPPRAVNNEATSASVRVAVSDSVDALLSGASAIPVVDAAATSDALPSVAAFLTWAKRVQVLEPELRQSSTRLTIERASRLRKLLGKSDEWSDVSLKNAAQEPASGALASWQEALRLTGSGCRLLRAALVQEVRSASDWSGALAEISDILEILKNGPALERLPLLRRLNATLPTLNSSLQDVRSSRAALDEVLKAPSTEKLFRVITDSELLRASCPLDAEGIETQFLLSQGAANRLLVETQAGLVVSEELNQVGDIVAAFLDLELFAMPSPSECKLPTEPEFEWVTQGLIDASRALRSFPKETLYRLQRLHKPGRGPLIDSVSRALPEAACEKVTQLLCTHLKRGRSVQTGAGGLAGLRRRADSLASASTVLLELDEQAKQFGCGQAFGLSDARQYARELVAQGRDVVAQGVPTLHARVEQFANTEDVALPGIRERAVDQIRLQRLEIGAVALGVIERALRSMEQTDTKLSPDEQQWKVALLDINSGRQLRKERAPDSGLFALERLLGLLLVRNNETCELAESASVLELMGERSGVFYDVGRGLVAAMRQQCGGKADG